MRASLFDRMAGSLVFPLRPSSQSRTNSPKGFIYFAFNSHFGEAAFHINDGKQVRLASKPSPTSAINARRTM